MQALGDRGWFNQVASAQVTGDEMVKVPHQVLPPFSSHVFVVMLERLKGNVSCLKESSHNSEERNRLALNIFSSAG